MATYYFQASCCGQRLCSVYVAIWLPSSGFTPQDCDNSLQSSTDLRQCYCVAVGYLSSARPDAMTEQPTHVLPGFSRLDKQFRLSKTFRHQPAHFAVCSSPWPLLMKWCLWIVGMKFYFYNVQWNEQNNCENKPLLQSEITFIKDFILQWITVKNKQKKLPSILNDFVTLSPFFSLSSKLFRENWCSFCVNGCHLVHLPLL